MRGLDRSIWLGFDQREAAAFAVARHSIQMRLSEAIPIHGVILEQLIKSGLYNRPTEHRDGRLWDFLSDAPMATQFSNSRFLVPHLAGSGWALFADSDVLARADLCELFEAADSSKAVMVVKHRYEPPEGLKMDGQAQLRYSRKNWSSVALWNVEHPSNRKLTIEMVNTVPGRDLHAFRWLDDSEIGELDPRWNWLAGHSDASLDPKIVHHTEGSPCLAGYDNAPYAQEWFDELRRWAS